MHQIEWTAQAYLDLKRFYEFLEPVNRQAAIQMVNALVTAPEKLSQNPRLGERLGEFFPNEVRRLVIGRYELRYEIKYCTVYVLKLWHARENR